MEPRLDYLAAAPAAIKAMLALEAYVKDCSLEHSLYELVKTRASQINGCAYCVHMHTRDARAAGETEERLYLLSAWRESPLYSPRERAALAWTEALTLVAETHAPDADLRRGAPALHRGGAGRPDPADRHDQRVEPPRHRLPQRPSGGRGRRAGRGGLLSPSTARAGGPARKRGRRPPVRRCRS